MKKRYIVGGIITIFLCAAYLALWVYSAKWFEQEIDNLYAQSQKDGIKFLGEKPVLSNFPFVPVVTYTNGIEAGNIKVLFPKLIVRGYPIPHTNLHLSFPDGVALGGFVDEKNWNANLFEADLSIPYHLPESFYAEDLRFWHDNQGKLNVKNYHIQKDHLIATGHGYLALDDGLQPIFNFISIIKGYDTFIDAQKDKNLLDPFAAAVGMTILNGLSKVDDITGEKTVTVNINVQNQMLWVGPIQALPLPMIVWDKHTPLAPHQ